MERFLVFLYGKCFHYCFHCSSPPVVDSEKLFVFLYCLETCTKHNLLKDADIGFHSDSFTDYHWLCFHSPSPKCAYTPACSRPWPDISTVISEGSEGSESSQLHTVNAVDLLKWFDPEITPASLHSQDEPKSPKPVSMQIKTEDIPYGKNTSTLSLIVRSQSFRLIAGCCAKRMLIRSCCVFVFPKEYQNHLNLQRNNKKQR